MVAGMTHRRPYQPHQGGSSGQSTACRKHALWSPQLHRCSVPSMRGLGVLVGWGTQLRNPHTNRTRPTIKVSHGVLGNYVNEGRPKKMKRKVY